VRCEEVVAYKVMNGTVYYKCEHCKHRKGYHTQGAGSECFQNRARWRASLPDVLDRSSHCLEKGAPGCVEITIPKGVRERHHPKDPDQLSKEQRIDLLPESVSVGFCHRCNRKHDWSQDEYMDCVPPLHVLQFGDYMISRAYREALFNEYPHYNTEEVVGSYLGYGIFPSQGQWEMGDKDQWEASDEDSDSS